MRLKTLSVAVLLGLSLVACGTTQTATAPEKQAVAQETRTAVHPELSEQEKLTPCTHCHQEVTPEIYQEWYQSRHGLDNVKCFQCHGTYEDFEVVPSSSRCMPCHAQEVTHAPKDKKCVACHPAHKFSVHK